MMNTKQLVLFVVVNISGGVNALVGHAQTETHKGSMLQMKSQVDVQGVSFPNSCRLWVY